MANGILLRQQTAGGWTTWTWDAREPMAAYLTTSVSTASDLAAETLIPSHAGLRR